MSCFALAHNDVRQAKGLQPLAAPAGLSPADLQSAYDLPSGTAGSGATPGLVDAYDAPNAEADPAVYRSQFGLPPCTTDNGCFPRTDPGVFRSAEEQAPVPVRPVPRGRGSGLPASASALVESGRSERSEAKTRPLTRTATPRWTLSWSGSGICPRNGAHRRHVNAQRAEHDEGARTPCPSPSTALCPSRAHKSGEPRSTQERYDGTVPARTLHPRSSEPQSSPRRHRFPS